MKNLSGNLVSVFLVLSFVSFGCASSKKAVSEEPKYAKSTVEDKVIDVMIERYGTPAAPKTQGKGLAPDFELQDIFYETHSLKNYEDNQQPVLLFFWTTWCPFCQKELRMLDKRYPTLVKDGLEVLAIDVGEKMDRVSNYIRRVNPGFKVLLDTDTGVSRAYRVAGVPTFVLVDKKGTIVFKDNTFPEKYQSLLVARETAK